jgi:hypothetical protein
MYNRTDAILDLEAAALNAILAYLEAEPAPEPEFEFGPLGARAKVALKTLKAIMQLRAADKAL